MENVRKWKGHDKNKHTKKMRKVSKKSFSKRQMNSTPCTFFQSNSCRCSFCCWRCCGGPRSNASLCSCCNMCVFFCCSSLHTNVINMRSRSSDCRMHCEGKLVMCSRYESSSRDATDNDDDDNGPRAASCSDGAPPPPLLLPLSVAARYEGPRRPPYTRRPTISSVPTQLSAICSRAATSTPFTDPRRNATRGRQARRLLRHREQLQLLGARSLRTQMQQSTEE